MATSTTPVFSLLPSAAHPATRATAAGHDASKVPPLIGLFWLIKIAATTLGETGGDALSMSFRLGYLVSSAVFLALLVVLVLLQVRARALHPGLYWSVIVATTTAGTTMADYCDRSLGIGYSGGVLLLGGVLAIVLTTWRLALGSVTSDRVTGGRQELFYWAAILASNTLGTAAGDWAADTGGLGYEGGAVAFSTLLVLVGLLHVSTGVSRVLLFWAAFVLTRPLGATLGDLLTKPRSHGGLAFDRTTASSLIAALMIGGILLYPRRATLPRPDGGAN